MKRWLLDGWGASAMLAGVLHAAVAFIVVEPGRASLPPPPVRLAMVSVLDAPKPDSKPELAEPELEPEPEPQPQTRPALDNAPIAPAPSKPLSPVETAEPAPITTAEGTEPSPTFEAPTSTDPSPDDVPVAKVPHSSPPPVGTPPGPKTARASGDLNGYGRGLRQRLLSQRRYPPMAERLELEGRAQVRVVVRRDGSLAGSPVLQKSTGHELLDREAHRMASAAAPYPPLPADHPHETATFVVPVRFAVPR